MTGEGMYVQEIPGLSGPGWARTKDRLRAVGRFLSQRSGLDYLFGSPGNPTKLGKVMSVVGEMAEQVPMTATTRIPIGAARRVFVPLPDRGGVSLNKVLSDALQPTRLRIADEVRNRILSMEMPVLPPGGVLIGQFPGMNTPAGAGPSRVVRAYETHAQTMRNLYKSPEAHRALADALKTGDRSNPLVQLYDEAKEGMATARASLDAYQAKMTSKRGRDTLASALSGFKTDAELAESLRAVPKKGPGVKAKAGELWPNVILPWVKDRATHPFSTVWSTVSYPFKHPFKVGIPLGVAGVVASTVNRSTRDTAQDTVTTEARKDLSKFENTYTRFTAGGALKSAMSDANALRAGLLGMREQALAELAQYGDRSVPVRARLEEYINSVKDTPAFAELMSRAETEYAGRALSPDDYQREFRERFRDPASQALGEDYWQDIGGAP